MQKVSTQCLLLVLLQIIHGIASKGKDNKGTEFIFGFMDNALVSSLEIFITTDELKSVDVNISTPLFDPTFKRTASVSYGQISKIVFDLNIRGRATELGYKGIYLQSQHEIAVYAVNKNDASTDAYVVFPLDAIGNNYYVISWTTKSEFMIIATQSNTTVHISLKNSGVIHYRGLTYTSGMTLVLQMDKFHTFHVYDVSHDFSGTKIQSNFPISVLSGNWCIKIGGGYCDHVVSQMTPIETLGWQFVTTDMPNCGRANRFRILASEPRTNINIPGRPSTYLSAAGDIYTFSVTDITSNFVSADKPVMVSFFAEGQCNGDIGDPMMVLIPPFQQYAADYSFATVNVPSNPFQNSLTIVIAEPDIAGLILDGNDVSPLYWRRVTGRADLRIKDFAVADGAHTVYHNNPTVTFLAISSGVASYNSYGYSTGQRLALINTDCIHSNSTPGDIIDNDCDGNIDEEIKDEIDNDGDGLIDEDLARHFCAPRRNNEIFRCDSNPCLNMATCVECRSFWKCDCLPGYTGDQCETEIDECASSPCVHGSECVDLIDEYTCHCLEGYTGSNCQTDINECNVNHCHNKGTCIHLINDYQCICANGYNGTNCEIDIDDCRSDPCMNTATCVDSISSWTCTCLPGFMGVQCEIDVYECDSNPCQRNGTCTDMINGYHCQCLNDTSGRDCEIWIDNCLSVSCPYNGQCINQYGGYVCDCPDPWHGDMCEYKEVNRTDQCTDLDYTECSCYINRLKKQEKKSYKLMSGLVGTLIGLVCTILPYVMWLLLQGTTHPNKIASEMSKSASIQDQKNKGEGNKDEEIPNGEGDHSITVSHTHCDCFVDHNGYDHFQRYDPKKSRFRFHKCQHKSRYNSGKLVFQN